MTITKQFQGRAPGKLILLGEHAVVYGAPAIAVPVTQVQAVATLEIDASAADLTVALPDVGETHVLAEMAASHPVAVAIRSTLTHLKQSTPTGRLTIESSIPIAGGMGSGAAISVAIMRALAAWAGKTLPVEAISALTFEVEKLYHGTPSGIDNTVVSHGQPVFFRREHPLELLPVGGEFVLVIGDTGVAADTRTAVGRVREAYQRNPDIYQALFDGMGALAQAARVAIEAGKPALLGQLLTRNHYLLQKAGVSSPELDRLVDAALNAGALGAKLSGGGLGGNMLALVMPERVEMVKTALQVVGAHRVMMTTIAAST